MGLFRKKKITSIQFADWLLKLHADAFGRETMVTVFAGSASPEAIFEWAIFGAWCISRAVCGNLSDQEVADSTMDSFFAQFYTSLRTHGMSGQNVTELSGVMRHRFRDYGDALAESSGGGPLHHLGKAVCRNVVPDENGLETLDFGGASISMMIAVAESIKEFTSELRVSLP